MCSSQRCSFSALFFGLSVLCFDFFIFRSLFFFLFFFLSFFSLSLSLCCIASLYIKKKDEKTNEAKKKKKKKSEKKKKHFSFFYSFRVVSFVLSLSSRVFCARALVLSLSLSLC